MLDCGCGDGIPMCRVHDAGTQPWGFDFVPEIVTQARSNLESRGLSERVWRGDITQANSFRPTGIDVPEAFDVTVALGVFPHIEEDVGALRNMAAVTRRGGRVFVEFRNELFGLFTLNRYSYELFCKKLMRLDDLRTRHPEYAAQLDDVAVSLEEFFKLDLPAVRTGTPDAPGYDEILSKFHNPLQVGQSFRDAGLRVANIHFYHYHAFPPILETRHAEPFRTLSLEMEDNPSYWRGYFMSSAFVVEAVKESDRK